MTSTEIVPTLRDDGRTYFFHGKFVPERVNIHLNYKDFGAKLSDRELRFTIFSHESNFNGKISSNVPFENAIRVYTIVYLILRNIIDRLGYLNLCGYDVDLIGAVSATGESKHIFGVYEPVFFDDLDQQRRFAKEKIQFIDNLLDFGFHDVRLDHALRCFSHALRDDAMTSLFCYIAIEAIARRVVEISDSTKIDDVRNEEWLKFRQKLNLKEATIKDDVKTLADNFRHGNFVDTSWEARKKMLALTWEIIRRGMHFIREQTDLSIKTFPEL
jgi:hypothetical protein